jgi:hypothetical protein
MKIKNLLYSFVILIGVIGLFTGIYAGFNDVYNIEDTNTKLINGQNTNIIGALNYLTVDIRGSVNTVVNAFKHITAPANPLDAAGALLSLGFGIFGTLWNVIEIPAKLLDIVIVFYAFPPILIDMVTLALLVSFALFVANLLSNGNSEADT